MKHDLPVFALLIDADNVSKDAIAPIIEEITRHARIAVRRVYGDFTTPNLAGWRETLANHGIHPIQQYRNSTGKNSSDSALIIDAMDLLHSRRFDGFSVVSSDGDFTRLATRIREDGLTVFGFGRKDAAKAFVQACDSYVFIENLLNPPELPKEGPPKVQITSMPENREAISPPNINGKPENLATPVRPIPIKATHFPDLGRLKNLISRAYTNVADEDGWALVSRVEQYLRANHSELNPSNYGAGTFFKLLASLDTFKVEQRKQGNGHAQFCRPKNSATPTKPFTSVKGLVPTHGRPSAAYIEALKAAVTATCNNEQWAKIADIRVHLHQNGHRLEGSGFDTLESAIRASGLFDMCDAGGSNKIFRLASGGELT